MMDSFLKQNLFVHRFSIPFTFVAQQYRTTFARKARWGRITCGAGVAVESLPDSLSTSVPPTGASTTQTRKRTQGVRTTEASRSAHRLFPIYEERELTLTAVLALQQVSSGILTGKAIYLTTTLTPLSIEGLASKISFEAHASKIK